MRQFETVNCKFGAPMGRSSYGAPEACDDRSVRVFRVWLDAGGYDDGGAYWGSGIPTRPLYCAMAPDYRAFVRAWSRDAAILELDIPGPKLARGLSSALAGPEGRP